MTAPVFLATLGQRPEAVTMALDVLLPRYHYREIVILHTDAQHSGVAAAFSSLLHELAVYYADMAVQTVEMRDAGDKPLLDIHDQASAEAYYLALLEVLRRYRVAAVPLHLLIAGGRKAMSLYAALAAALLFGEHDQVWTVHTPHNLMQPGAFHAPPGMHDRVQVIALPVTPSRLLPGLMAETRVEALLEQARISPRQQFLGSLSEEERRLTDMLRLHPYARNEALAALLTKSAKTVEHQLGSVYAKLFEAFNIHVEDKRKRQVLLDVLAGRV